MAKPHRAELSLRDSTAADGACVVRASASRNLSKDFGGGSLRGRAWGSISLFLSAQVPDPRGLDHHRVSAFHRVNGELHILQPADDRVVHSAPGRSPFA